MRKNNWHSSNVGSKAENTVMESLDALSIRYTKEKVANSRAQGKTNKGEFDFRIHLENYDHCIECKTTSTRVTIPNASNTNPNIKQHQLRQLREALLDGHKAGFILNFRGKTEKWFYMSLKQFDTMVFDKYPINAITLAHAEKYATPIDVSDGGKLRLKSIVRG